MAGKESVKNQKPAPDVATVRATDKHQRAGAMSLLLSFVKRSCWRPALSVDFGTRPCQSCAMSTAQLIAKIKVLPEADRTRVAEFVEQLTEAPEHQRDARDLAIIDHRAGRLNREAVEVLEYQAPL
jgi:thioredoxin-like negative regulator of GroEL